MSAQAADLLPGFTDPVLDSQRVFRVVLDAMARPGTIQQIAAPEPPEPVDAAAGAVLLCLADHDTPVWLDQRAAAPAVSAWLAFHCGCPLVGDPAQATFVLIADPEVMPPPSAFEIGSDDYPDRSATVIVQVPSLADGAPLVLAGPGIRERATLAPQGLPSAFKDWVADNHALFPRGVDFVFASGNRIAALPRSTWLKG